MPERLLHFFAVLTTMTPESIRTAISAAALVLTLGSSIVGGVLALKSELTELQTSVAALTTAVADLRCDIHPDYRVCR